MFIFPDFLHFYTILSKKKKYRKTLSRQFDQRGVSFTFLLLLYRFWSANHASMHPYCFSILRHVHQTRPPVFFMRIPEAQQLFSYLQFLLAVRVVSLCRSLVLSLLISLSLSLSLSPSPSLSHFL